MMALARDLVQEIAAGQMLELAAETQSPPFAPAKPPAQATAARNPIPRGPAAVHPQLGQHLARLPGDTISGHAYSHLGMVAPGM
jgi:hypothetical protein